MKYLVYKINYFIFASVDQENISPLIPGKGRLLVIDILKFKYYETE